MPVVIYSVSRNYILLQWYKRKHWLQWLLWSVGVQNNLIRMHFWRMTSLLGNAIEWRQDDDIWKLIKSWKCFKMKTPLNYFRMIKTWNVYRIAQLGSAPLHAPKLDASSHAYVPTWGHLFSCFPRSCHTLISPCLLLSELTSFVLSRFQTVLSPARTPLFLDFPSEFRSRFAV